MSDDSEPTVPPIFRFEVCVAGTDVRAEAIRRAESGVDGGTLLWLDSREDFAAAIVLAPEQPLRECAEIYYVASLSFGDALAQALPPMQDNTFALPSTMLLNGAWTGSARVDAPPDAGLDDVPGWLVVSVNLAVEGEPDYDDLIDGFMPTSLVQERITTVTSGDLLAAFSRQFLVWLRRWQDDGFAPVKVQWKHRAHEIGVHVTRRIAGRDVDAVFEDISDDAELVFVKGKDTMRIPAVDLLARGD